MTYQTYIDSDSAEAEWVAVNSYQRKFGSCTFKPKKMQV